jgi:dTDP-4-dehydrorhamnose reductase
MRLVILGSGGRLGAALARRYHELGDDVRGFTHAELDLADDLALKAALAPLDFDVLINCAALTNVDHCETHPEEAHRINASAVRTIAESCAQKGRRCIHISTDYVFDGAKVGAYSEEDEARPISVYGLSKRAGELALLEASDKHLAVRVSWVFGPDRPSFIDGILKRALDEDTVEAIADKVAVPTFTVEASDLLRPFLQEVPAGGLLHLCNAGSCTWQTYGQVAIDRAVAAGAPMKAREVKPLMMADVKAFVAKRPSNTAMSTERLTSLTGLTPRPWQRAVEEYLAEFWIPANCS